MSVAVLIPWRGGCPHRIAALGWVLARYVALGWPVIVGNHGEGPWRKALAVRAALERTDADVLVLADADCWTGGVLEAVERVEAGAAWAVPHRGVYRLTRAATAAWLAGERWADLADAPLAEAPYRGFEGGGVTVVRREAYEACPLDPRFAGWGGEDETFGWALRTLYGPALRPTGYAPLVHLWHPEPQRATRSFGSLVGRDLRKRYARALNDPVAMTALLEEVTAWPLLTC